MSVNLDLNKAFEQAMDFYRKKGVTITQGEGHPYLQIKDDPNGENVKYCAICFGYEGKLVPLFNGQVCAICTKR